jgi:hypothetical protein
MNDPVFDPTIGGAHTPNPPDPPMIPELPTSPLKPIKVKWWEMFLFKLRKNKTTSTILEWIKVILLLVFPEGKIAAVILGILEKATKKFEDIEGRINQIQTTGVSMPDPIVKPGIKSTEFWMTLVMSLAAIAGGLTSVIPPQVAAVIVAVLTGVYNVLRALVKSPDITTLVSINK